MCTLILVERPRKHHVHHPKSHFDLISHCDQKNISTTNRQSESIWSTLQSPQGGGGREGGAGGGAGGGHPVHHEPRISCSRGINLNRLNILNLRGRNLLINITQCSLPPLLSTDGGGVGDVAVGCGGECRYRGR